MAATAPETATVAPGAPATARNVGRVVQVIGPVIDAEFDRLPDIYNALVIRQPAAEGRDAIDVTLEVQQHVGRNQVRAVAMSPTDGVVRGMEVLDTGSSITVPVGANALGRIIDVLVRCSGNQSSAARMLGISRSTLLHRLDAYRISRPRKRPPTPT